MIPSNPGPGFWAAASSPHREPRDRSSWPNSTRNVFGTKRKTRPARNRPKHRRPIGRRTGRADRALLARRRLSDWSGRSRRAARPARRGGELRRFNVFRLPAVSLLCVCRRARLKGSNFNSRLTRRVRRSRPYSRARGDFRGGRARSVVCARPDEARHLFEALHDGWKRASDPGPARRTRSRFRSSASRPRAAFKDLFREGWPWSRRRPPISTARGARNRARSAPGRARLCDREHAADDPADAGRVLAPAPARGQRGRVDAGTRRWPSATGSSSRGRISRCAPELFEQLPATLRDLSRRSLRMQERVIHLDQRLADRPFARAARRGSRVVDAGRAAAGGVFALTAGREAAASDGPFRPATDLPRPRFGRIGRRDSRLRLPDHAA